MPNAPVPSASLLSLPDDLLIPLPEHLHNIEDLVSLSSTCTRLNACMASAPPNAILRLACAQSRIFFQPSPHFLLLSVARQLGHWARRSRENETVFAQKCGDGIEGLLELAKEKCGLTLDRIRELHALRCSLINPVMDLIDRCVGDKRYETDGFPGEEDSDPRSICGEPAELFFHLSIYGEIYGPELEAYVESGKAKGMSADTRLQFVEYCIPDWIMLDCTGIDCFREDGSLDQPRYYSATRPNMRFADEDLILRRVSRHNNLALKWMLNSSRWRPYWKEARVGAGAKEFLEDFDDYHISERDTMTPYWRQKLWENIMVCHGLEGLGMMRPGLRETWYPKINEWREKVEKLQEEDHVVVVEGVDEWTHRWPYLMGDLMVLGRGW